MALLELHNIEKIYTLSESNSLAALAGVSLSIEAGEYVAIVGPSGSGKSTLLHILGLLDTPSSGQYRIFGMDTQSLTDDALTHIRSKYMGFVFQMFNLLPRISAQDNVILPMIYTGDRYQPDRAVTMLQQLGMGQHLQHSSNQLSGGQQQRVAIARALINSPQLILADEPTGNLPQKQAQDIFEELERLHAQGLTLVVITHSEQLAQRADRLIRIVDGKIVEDRSKTKATKVHEHKTLTPQQLRPQITWNVSLWWETLRLAMQSLANNRIRTLLTMLGMIIGVFSVIALLSISKGAQSSVEHELRRIGSNMFRVSPEWPKIKGAASHQRSITHLNERDLSSLQALRYQNPDILQVAATSQGTAVLTYRGYSYSTKVMGVSPSFESMRDAQVSFGRFFTNAENERQERVCVLGQTVYEQLFKAGENPIGQVVRVDDSNYRVIGIVPAKGSSWGEDIDDVIYIPVETARRRLFGRNHYNHMFVQASSETTIDEAMSAVSQLLRRNHNLPRDVENDFTITNYGEMRQAIEKVSTNFLILIVLIGSISLVVGGIGIMNIMLVSVTERTREIGIRKAIGARRRDILSQFLVEAVFISFIGALIGVMLGYVFCLVLERFLAWDVVFDPWSVLLAFVFSVLVGLFFGLYPAQKAARLSPINALRYE